MIRFGGRREKSYEQLPATAPKLREPVSRQNPKRENWFTAINQRAPLLPPAPPPLSPQDLEKHCATAAAATANNPRAQCLQRQMTFP